MYKIDPEKTYSLQEIVDAGFIPGINGHAAMYNLVAQKVPAKKSGGKLTRVMAAETTRTSIKAIDPKPWNKISGKIQVKGEEILKFLDIHNLNKKV